jgi:bifunctional non-homologous end joining protein LigD
LPGTDDAIVISDYTRCVPPEDENDSLERYRKKRDPRVTNEPFAVAAPGAAQHQTIRGNFVVHLHDATRRHFDLRLQMEGALASFAVPRGPSLDPKEKRLAVQTENHPLEYLDFEDVIPEGNYGAGPMIVWDTGTVEYREAPAESGLKAGKIDFWLAGHKLRGRFALVETTGRVQPKPKQRQWLLLKKQDAHSRENAPEIVDAQPESVLSGLRVEELAQKEARQAALLDEVKGKGAKLGQVEFRDLVPMLCANEGAELTDSSRYYELKLDGVRIVARRSGSDVRLKYRKPRFATESYPEIARALEASFVTDFTIDGEIVAFDENGKPSFQRIAPRIHATRVRDAHALSSQIPVVYLVFDLLTLGPYDLTGLPLSARKELLARFVPRRGLVRLLDHLDGKGDALFRLCQQQGLEGVVSKDKNSPYQFGPERTTAWVKHKCERLDEFVVIGWVEGKGQNRSLGALELGSYRGDRLVYRGRVGSGFDQATLTDLGKRLDGLALDALDFEGEPIEDGRPRHAVEPVMVVRVRYLEWTDESRLRMAVFDGFSTMPPRACAAAPEEERLTAALATSEATPVLSATPTVILTTPSLSNLDKVFWPEEGYTKGDLLAYYEQIAPVLLPHLRDRPIMLVRYPDGIEGKSFYQWNVPKGTPEWLDTLDLRNEEQDGKNVTTFLVHDVDSLLHVINLGCIPIHVLAARKQTLDQCDFLTVDFDLGDQPFTEAVRLALSLKELLDELGLFGYPKTSGQEGLHVFIPLGPRIPFPVAKGLVELLGRLLQLRHPETSTMQRRVGERSGRAYIDTGQTGRSRTIVAPYSVRAHRGGTVSTPLFWEEVHLALRPEAWTMFTVPERAQSKGDPWAQLLEVRPNVLGAVTQLEKMLKG